MPKPFIAINANYDEDLGAKHQHGRADYGVPVAYVNAIAAAGGVPLLLPPVEKLATLDPLIDMAHGFLFIGGRDYPPALYGAEPHPQTEPMHDRRASADLYIANHALETAKPLLAICGGLQLINIARGGKIIQHLPSVDLHRDAEKKRDLEHAVEIIEDDSLLAVLFERRHLVVNSSHHQAAPPDHLGKELRVTAVAADGTIEALELAHPQGRFFLAVQWHPERIRDADHRRVLFYALIDACK